MAMAVTGTHVAPNGEFALAWRNMKEAPFVDDLAPGEDHLYIGATLVDLNTGMVQRHFMGSLAVMSGDQVHAGPYDGWALDTKQGFTVRWRGKRLVDLVIDPLEEEDRLIFSDTSVVKRVKSPGPDMNISAPFGTGLIQMDLTPKRNLGRTVRRALQAGGQMNDIETWIAYQGQPGAWPPPPPPKIERYDRYNRHDNYW